MKTDAAWHEKVITEKEFEGSSSHVGILVPSKAVKGQWNNGVFVDTPVQFNGKPVTDRNGAQVTATRPNRNRKEVRIQAIAPLKETGLVAGHCLMRVEGGCLEVRQFRPAAWLVIAAGDNRQHAGNDGYDDVVDSHYSYDQTVGNHRQVTVGDVIVLWDKKNLLGMSVVERITVGARVKVRRKCPHCGQSAFKERKKSPPDSRFRCDRKHCRKTFSTPSEVEEEVTTYVTDHGDSWVDLEGKIDGETLRTLVVGKSNQPLSIRRLDWARFTEELNDSVEGARGLPPMRRLDQLGGFTEHCVRARRGQQKFRRDLLEKFNNKCAFTGLQPEQALEAAHLYSYAEVGVHHEHGGLLLRRDLHALFDGGRIGVDPDTDKIWVRADLDLFTHYEALRGEQVKVPLTEKSRGWLRYHRDQNQPPSSSAR